MQGILTNTGCFDVKLEEEVAGITAATLANYDVLIDYYYGPWLARGNGKSGGGFCSLR